MSTRLSWLARNWAPRQQLSEAMAKRWFEAVVPATLLLLVLVVVSSMVPGFITLSSLSATSREFAEFGFVALAMAVVLIGGGIDLSVGSIFALANFAALYCLVVLELPTWACLIIVPAFGACLGAINGLLIGVLKSRALLTTMATLMIFRAVYELLIYRFGTDLSIGFVDSPLFDFMGIGSVFGVPSNMLALIVTGIALHLFLSRMRLGWHFAAVGAGRLASRHAGLRVNLLVFSVYVFSGVLASVGGLFYSARFFSAGRDAGLGIEIEALTAIVLGGVSLMGGKGSVGRAMLGAVIIFLINNGLVRAGVISGMNSMLMGLLMIVAVAIDVKVLKNLPRFASQLYVDPSRVKTPALPDLSPAAGSPFAINFDLRGISPIGFRGEDFGGQEDVVLDDREMRLFNPEDVLIDDQARVYTGTSNGLIIRYFGQNYADREVFARPGGQVRGMAWGRNDDLLALVAGVGLLSIASDGAITRLADETNRTFLRLRDDSRLSSPAAVSVAPDGKIYFSESSYRYESGDLVTDAIEARPNGRLLCFDPNTGRTRTILSRLVHPYGVSVAPDGQSLLFSETWLCRISRLWLAGPKKGQVETVLDDLPVYPANITTAPDGGVWVAILGCRTPAFDFFAGEPAARYRMVRQLPRDEWLAPNLNVGGAFKLTPAGAVDQVLWEPQGRGQNYAAVTSAREHGDYLFLAGVFNNRIGRKVINPDSPTWQSANFLYPHEGGGVTEAAE